MIEKSFLPSFRCYMTRHMNKFTLITLSSLTMLTATSTFAEGEKYNDRQGFMIGFGLGGGGLSIHDAGNSLDRGAFIGNFRIGGGLSEKFILMGESTWAMTNKNDTDISVSGLLFSAQYFCTQNFYLRPGFGFAVGRSVTSVGSVTVTNESDVGFAMNAASGYEFRLSKSFVLAPEVDVGYAHIQGSDNVNYGVILGLTWYL